MNFKRLIAFVLSTIVLLLACPTVSAAPTPIINISNASAKPGDEVSVNVSITSNPGISAMVFSITYDQNNLEFIGFVKGFISTPVYEDHSDNGYIAFAVSESSDKKNAGSIMTLTFKAKDTATPGKYTITMANNKPLENGSDLSNAFSNSKQETFIPTVKAGSITVLGPCDIEGHKYGAWATTNEGSCSEFGTRERTCSVCKKVEEAQLPYKHDFEEEWTVDKVATPEENGIMSRHCKLCDEVTDTITFRYDEITDDNDNESSDTNSSPEDDNSDTTSSGDGSDTDNTTSDDSTTDNTSSDNTTTNKPIIDNTEGAKNPLEEVEKLEDFENLPKPEEPETPDDEPIVDDSSKIPETQDPPSSDTSSTASSDEVTEENVSFLSTPMGTVIIVVCLLLSCGIVALGVMLILKNRKNELPAEEKPQDNE